MSMFSSQLQGHDGFVMEADLQDAKNDVLGKSDVVEVT